MNILVNASNLKLGGGLQVADSICYELNKFPQHTFVVALSKNLDKTEDRIKDYNNVSIVRYDVKNSCETLFVGRDSYLDRLVKIRGIDCVLTIFGPSRWNPRVPHISGFAMPHLALDDSPYFSKLNWVGKIKSKLKNILLTYVFRRSTNIFYTENPLITALLKRKWRDKDILTITNYYNQIFDTPKKWKNHPLSDFDGTTLLCVTANYPHKNLGLSIHVARELIRKYPDFKFRFVFTVTENDIDIPEDLRDKFLLIGKVDISECPSLYRQADIMFQPSLLECFTATYPEAMRMQVPIVTTDLEFARGLCGNAALYFSSLDASDAAEKIYKVSNNQTIRKQLIDEGLKQLNQFDTASQRAEKLIKLCEDISKSKP